MPFAAGLQQSLHARHGEVASEFERGDSLEEILSRHLLAVEAMSERHLLTSILLLSPDGQRLTHGAAPNLPRAYREAIDGSRIGPAAGSCGTAAYLGRPIHVADIATDPLWEDYRDHALTHGLRSCWSTPIRDTAGDLIGTFAIYHRVAGKPTTEELEAIELITDHVARAIMSARDQAAPRSTSHLRLVHNDDPRPDPVQIFFDSLLAKAVKLEIVASELEAQAVAEQDDSRRSLESLAADSRRLADIIRQILGS
jgi:GAF domain-containing protein